MLGLTLAACGRLSEPRAGPATSPTASDASSGGPDVICDGSGTRIANSTVEARSDGVHVLIENPTSKHLGFQWGSPDGAGGGENLKREGLTRLVLDVAPGMVKVNCIPEELEEVPTSEWAEMRVVDPDGVWTSPELECASGGSVSSSGGSYAEAPEGDPRDPEELAREFFDPKPGDQVRVAGYPEAEERTIILVRDGRTIAAAYYADASFAGGKRGSGWISNGYDACAGWEA